MDRNSKIADALDVWAPTYPRRVNRHQQWTNGKMDAVRKLREAEAARDNSPFISTYSFPDGHTKDGELPRIDTLFIDFDFEGGDYVAGSGDRQAWRRDLSHLLVRVRRVAKYLVNNGYEGWRASLSGHKGVHLFLDFEPLGPDHGSFDQYVQGLNEYAEDLVADLAEKTGLDDLSDYVDVTSSDLGRLCRVPNTIHGGASTSFGERRFCVPVTLEELSELSVDSYESLTSAPRDVPWDERNQNSEAPAVITRYIETATGKLGYSQSGTGSIADYTRVQKYREQSNDDITIDDIEFLTSDRPCVWEFYKRDDKWDYGVQSHNMEIYCIRELQEKNVPIDVMKDFFDSAPGYDEEYTERIIEEVIARDYNRFRTDTLLEKAPEFCGYDHCKRCQRILSEQDISTHE